MLDGFNLVPLAQKGNAGFQKSVVGQCVTRDCESMQSAAQHDFTIKRLRNQFPLRLLHSCCTLQHTAANLAAHDASGVVKAAAVTYIPLH